MRRSTGVIWLCRGKRWFWIGRFGSYLGRSCPARKYLPRLDREPAGGREICIEGHTIRLLVGIARLDAEGIAGAEFTLVKGGNHGYLRQMPEQANPLFINFFERHPV